MLWFILSFLTALAVASHDAWVKKFFSDLSTYEMLAYPMIYSLPLLILTLPFVPVPPLDGIFFSAFLIIRGNSALGNNKSKATGLWSRFTGQQPGA